MGEEGASYLEESVESVMLSPYVQGRHLWVSCPFNKGSSHRSTSLLERHMIVYEQ